MIKFDAEHAAVHYPPDRHHRLWIRPSILIGIAAAIAWLVTGGRTTPPWYNELMGTTDAIERISQLLDSDMTETSNTSMRIPTALREAAALAAKELNAAPSATALTTMALRSALEAAVMRAALDDHYAQYPEARPDLADIAIATAELSGNPLATDPDRIRRAAAEIAAARVTQSRRTSCSGPRPGRSGHDPPRGAGKNNEAVQALASPRHPKHQRVLGHMEAVERRKRHAAAISLHGSRGCPRRSRLGPHLSAMGLPQSLADHGRAAGRCARQRGSRDPRAEPGIRRRRPYRRHTAVGAERRCHRDH